LWRTSIARCGQESPQFDPTDLEGIKTRSDRAGACGWRGCKRWSNQWLKAAEVVYDFAVSSFC
jgi:hypothetical protein